MTTWRIRGCSKAASRLAREGYKLVEPGLRVPGQVGTWGGYTFLAEEGQVSFMYFFDISSRSERAVDFSKFLRSVS